MAPADDKTQLIAFDKPLMSVPQVLGPDDVRALTLSGRGTWELRIEGRDGFLVLYSRPGASFPSADLVAELDARLETTTVGGSGRALS